MSRLVFESDAIVNVESVGTHFAEFGAVLDVYVSQQGTAGAVQFDTDEACDKATAESRHGVGSCTLTVQRALPPTGADDAEGVRIYIVCSKFVDNAGLGAVFEAFGEVLDIKLLRDSGGNSRGCAFVTFRDRASAEAAVQKCNGKLLMKKTMKVMMAERRRSSSCGGGSASAAPATPAGAPGTPAAQGTPATPVTADTPAAASGTPASAPSPSLSTAPAAAATHTPVAGEVAAPAAPQAAPATPAAPQAATAAPQAAATAPQAAATAPQVGALLGAVADKAAADKAAAEKAAAEKAAAEKAAAAANAAANAAAAASPAAAPSTAAATSTAAEAAAAPAAETSLSENTAADVPPTAPANFGLPAFSLPEAQGPGGAARLASLVTAAADASLAQTATQQEAAATATATVTVTAASTSAAVGAEMGAALRALASEFEGASRIYSGALEGAVLREGLGLLHTLQRCEASSA